MAKTEVKYKIRAQDKTKAAIASARKGLKRLNKTFDTTAAAAKNTARDIGIIFTSTSATMALTAKSAVKASAKFGAAVSELSAITGATGKDLEFLSDKAREFGATTTLSATDAALAFKLVASAKPDLLGNADALSQVTKEVITLAEASGTELTDAAVTVGSALNQFSAGAEDAGKFINVLAAGSKFGASEITDTAKALEKAGTVAFDVGLSFEETNAAIQSMALVSIKGERAGTGLKTMLIKLASQTRDEFNPEIVGFTQAMKNLSAANLTTTEKTKLYGAEAITSANAIISNADSLDTLIGKLTGTDVAYEQARIRQDNWAGDLKKLNSLYEESKIAIGKTIEPALRELAALFIQNTDNALSVARAIDDKLITGLQVGTVAAALFVKSFSRVRIGFDAFVIGVDSVKLGAKEIKNGFLAIQEAWAETQAFLLKKVDPALSAVFKVVGANIKIQRIKLKGEIGLIKKDQIALISELENDLKNRSIGDAPIDAIAFDVINALERGRKQFQAFKTLTAASMSRTIPGDKLGSVPFNQKQIKENIKATSQASIEGLQGIIDDENAKYTERVDALRRFHELTKAGDVSYFDSFKAGIKEAQIEFENSYELMLASSKSTTFALRDGFKTGFVDLIKGDVDSIPDAFRQMGQSIIDIWINMIAEMLAQWVLSGIMNLPVGIQGIGGSALNGAVSGATGAAVGGSLIPASVTGAVGAETTVFGGSGIGAFLAAHPIGAAVAAIAVLTQTNALNEIGKGAGNVVNEVGRGISNVGNTITKGIQDIGNFFGFAEGGVVDRPTRALVGEAGPEAIVPLSGGRSIPVEIKGSARAVTFNINIDARGADAGVETKIRAAMAIAVSQARSAIADDFQRFGAVRRAI